MANAFAVIHRKRTFCRNRFFSSHIVREHACYRTPLAKQPVIAGCTRLTFTSVIICATLCCNIVYGDLHPLNGDHKVDKVHGRPNIGKGPSNSYYSNVDGIEPLYRRSKSGGQGDYNTVPRGYRKNGNSHEYQFNAMHGYNTNEGNYGNKFHYGNDNIPHSGGAYDCPFLAHQNYDQKKNDAYDNHEKYYGQNYGYNKKVITGSYYNDNIGYDKSYEQKTSNYNNNIYHNNYNQKSYRSYDDKKKEIHGFEKLVVSVNDVYDQNKLRPEKLDLSDLIFPAKDILHGGSDGNAHDEHHSYSEQQSSYTKNNGDYNNHLETLFEGNDGNNDNEIPDFSPYLPKFQNGSPQPNEYVNSVPKSDEYEKPSSSENGPGNKYSFGDNDHGGAHNTKHKSEFTGSRRNKLTKVRADEDNKENGVDNEVANKKSVSEIDRAESKDGVDILTEEFLKGAKEENRSTIFTHATSTESANATFTVPYTLVLSTNFPLTAAKKHTTENVYSTNTNEKTIFEDKLRHSFSQTTPATRIGSIASDTNKSTMTIPEDSITVTTTSTTDESNEMATEDTSSTMTFKEDLKEDEKASLPQRRQGNVSEENDESEEILSNKHEELTRNETSENQREEKLSSSGNEAGFTIAPNLNKFSSTEIPKDTSVKLMNELIQTVDKQTTSETDTLVVQNSTQHGSLTTIIYKHSNKVPTDSSNQLTTARLKNNFEYESTTSNTKPKAEDEERRRTIDDASANEELEEHDKSLFFDTDVNGILFYTDNTSSTNKLNFKNSPFTGLGKRNLELDFNDAVELSVKDKPKMAIGMKSTLPLNASEVPPPSQEKFSASYTPTVQPPSLVSSSPLSSTTSATETLAPALPPSFNPTTIISTTTEATTISTLISVTSISEIPTTITSATTQRVTAGDTDLPLPDPDALKLAERAAISIPDPGPQSSCPGKKSPVAKCSPLFICDGTNETFSCWHEPDGGKDQIFDAATHSCRRKDALIECSFDAICVDEKKTALPAGQQWRALGGTCSSFAYNCDATESNEVVCTNPDTAVDVNTGICAEFNQLGACRNN